MAETAQVLRANPIKGTLNHNFKFSNENSKLLCYFMVMSEVCLLCFAIFKHAYMLFKAGGVIS